jgi:Protein of unknown function, DUF481
MTGRFLRAAGIIGLWISAIAWPVGGVPVGGAMVHAAETANPTEVYTDTGTSPSTSGSAGAPRETENTETAWDRFVPPPDDKFDWIQLKSGEWLKGELKVMYNYSLEFDSDELELLEFDWEDVKQIRTARSQRVRLEDSIAGGKPFIVVGILSLKDGKLYVESGDKTREFDRDQIVAIAESAARELDRWSGKLSLGINRRGGNSDTTDGSAIVNLKRRTASSRFVTDYLGNYSQAVGETTSNNHRLSTYYDIFETRKLFWRPVAASYYQDRFVNVQHQVYGGAGFGYNVIRTSKTEWELTGGAGVVYKSYVSVAPGVNRAQTSASVGGGTQYETDVTSWIHYLLGYTFQIVKKDSGLYLHHLITTLETDLIHNLDLDVSLVWDRVQDPQPTADGDLPKKDDYQFILSVAYEF